MKIIGVDPGKTGAVAFINGDQIQFAEFEDLKALEAALKNWKPEFAIIEKVHAMPKQGVSSTFKFGYYAGLIEGVILGLGIPYAFVTPQEWQKGLFAITDGDGKQRSLKAAKRLFPQAVPDLKLKKHHNRADALLIAWYGMNLKPKAKKLGYNHP